MKKLLELLGLPTKNAQGHELGCPCDVCRDARREIKSFPEHTVGKILQDEARRRRERKGS